jgi:CRISPR-associated protein Cmr2
MPKELHASLKGIKAEQIPEILSRHDLNILTRMDLLSAALPTGLKETAKAHYRSVVLDDEQIRNEYTERLEMMERLGLMDQPTAFLDQSPVYAVALQLEFKLMTAFLSKDDDAFYIHDNPVRKEKVFRLPFMPGAGWKGCLRAADGDSFIEEIKQKIDGFPENPDIENLDLSLIWSSRARRIRVFGNENNVLANYFNSKLSAMLLKKLKRHAGKTNRFEKDRLQSEFNGYLVKNGYRTEKVEGSAGGLHCLPTYFTRLGLEVINPHDRQRRVGTHPIYFESVPPDTTGSFGFFYLNAPYGDRDRESMPETTQENKSYLSQLADDIEVLGNAVSTMFIEKGFGAKTSSGFGSTENGLASEGVLQLKMPVIDEQQGNNTISKETCIWQVPLNRMDELKEGFAAMAKALRGMAT